MKLLAAVFAVLASAAPSPAADPGSWPAVTLLAPREVEWSGAFADSFRRGVERLAADPFTAEWLLADVSFKMDRIFTNYSGDASGRFIELASLTSPKGHPSPAALTPVLSQVPSFQKSDGHFGVEVDLKKPLAKASPPIPMLWGNARLLVGLVTAARETGDAGLLAAAKKLGDFYVCSAGELTSPAREADYRSSGTYGDGYTCCYFPAIESLALLHRATGDGRYLEQARRMADLFFRMDVLPVDHSHGNLCAWRGVLELHGSTGERTYLERARAKWEAAMAGGFVWPIGGIGEHWMVFFEGDEGCSESDWLRFNLDLWRYTGETRYLDVAERLLWNQYLENQTPNGGYGMRHFDGDGSGPLATRGAVDEWPFCCSFHGPLGLHFLKGYLAAVSEQGVFVNFPLDFTAPLRVAGRPTMLSVRTAPDGTDGVVVEIELAPRDDPAPLRTALRVRLPSWAERAFEVGDGAPRALEAKGGRLVFEREFRTGEKVRVRLLHRGLRIEDRRMREVTVDPARVTRLREVCLAAGPDLLAALPSPPSGRPAVIVKLGPGGIELLAPSVPATAEASSIDAAETQIPDLVASGRPVSLRPLREIRSRRRAAFVFDLVVVPESRIPAASAKSFAERAAPAASAAQGPYFGDDLEKTADLWIGGPGWKFTPEGLMVSGGDVGLLDGEGYRDYRFEFELTLPAEGQGISGWVARAQDGGDCLMFQIQSADSTYNAPEFKTRPNTFRPHVRRGGAWQIAEPVVLPREVRRGETHRIAVECRGDRVEVFLDGERAWSGSDSGLRTGTVGFRAAGPTEQGLFRKVSLRKL